MTLRALELFSGIGGFAAAVAELDVRVMGALDQDPAALESYRLNFPDHPTRRVDLERVSAWELIAPAVELWWLSPPCQPYCERGARRDLDDHRAGSIMHLMELLSRIPGAALPQHLALENVVGFVGSQAHGRLVELLAGRGYQLRERLLCPTQLGIPSRRPRFYLTASLSPLAPEKPASPRFGAALPILEPDDPLSVTTCFTSGYGRSLTNAGSYLRCGSRVRRFSPEEIIRLLHFSPAFRFPPGMTLRRRWGLAGNSLSVVAVREVLAAFPEF